MCFYCLVRAVAELLEICSSVDTHDIEAIWVDMLLRAHVIDNDVKIIIGRVMPANIEPRCGGGGVALRFFCPPAAESRIVCEVCPGEVALFTAVVISGYIIGFIPLRCGCCVC